MLLLMDGQGHYTAAQMSRKWGVDSTNCVWDMPTDGRWSGNPCLRRTSNSNAAGGGYVQISPLLTRSGIWTPTASGVFGFAVKCDNLARIGSGTVFEGMIAIMNGSGAQLVIKLDTAGSLIAMRSTNGVSLNVTLGTSLAAITSAVWAFVEVKWLIHASAGYVEIRVNGNIVLRFDGNTLSGAATGGNLGAAWTTIRLFRMVSAISPYLVMRMNDFYLCDLSGSGDDLRDYLGNVRVQILVPNAVGTSSGWTPNAGANWEAVDDNPADDDTSYVSALAAGTRDAYGFTDLPAGASPLGFQISYLAKKEAEGNALIAPMFWQGVNSDGISQSINSSVAYQYVLNPFDRNPVSDARPTAAELNAAEFGFVKTI